MAINLLVHFAFAPNRQHQLFRQGIDHGYPHAVQATGYLVGVVVKLTPGVQHGHDDLGSGDALLVHFRRDTPAVVGNTDRFIGVNNDGDLATVTRQRLIDRVVHQLEHHMVQAGAIVGIPDVHTGAFAHRIQAFQDLDTGGIVVVLGVTHVSSLDYCFY